jgi:hypothetical protein
MIPDLDAKTWLGLTVVGTIVSTLGVLIATFLKDYLFARSFEVWRQRRTLEQVYLKYRDPLLLSARELALRQHEILGSYPLLSGLDSVDMAHGVDSTRIQAFGDVIGQEKGPTPCGIRIAFCTMF